MYSIVMNLGTIYVFLQSGYFYSCLISFITAVNAFVSNTLYLKFENIVGYPFPFQQNIFAGIVQK